MSEESSVLVTGDFCPINRISELVDAKDYKEVFRDFLPIIEGSDLAITNLECPITDTNKEIDKFGPHLKTEPRTARMLADVGFNLVTLANNHIMDYGVKGLESTIRVCEENRIHFVGAGLDHKQAREVKYLRIRKHVVAILNFTENEFSTTDGNYPGANPHDLIDNYRDIAEAKKKSDFVFVIFHGGHEMYNLPSPRIKKTFRYYADAGADVILSHHTHCYSGYEVYKDVPIFYGLGNFIFDNNGRTRNEWNFGFAVNIRLNSTINFDIIPYEQCSSQAGIHLLSDKEAFMRRIDALNSLISNDNLLDFEFQKYCRKSEKMYSSFLEPHSIRILHYLQNRKLFPSILGKRKRILYSNLFRCESHREVILFLLGRNRFKD